MATDITEASDESAKCCAIYCSDAEAGVSVDLVVESGIKK